MYSRLLSKHSSVQKNFSSKKVAFFFLGIFSILFFSQNLNAQKNPDHTDFSKSELNSGKANIKVIESNENYILLEYSAPKAELKPITGINGETYYQPFIPGTYTEETKSGSPQNLIYTANISVPNPAGFKLEFANVSSQFADSKLIAPFPSIKNIEGDAVEVYNANNELYKGLDDFVKLKYTGIAGDRYIAQLKINAARWNGKLALIQQPLKMIIKISFMKESNSQNNSFSGLSQTTSNNISIINFKQTPGFSVPRLANNLSSAKNKELNKIQKSNNNWIKLEVIDEGIYKIDASQLSSIGVTIAPSDVPTIQIFGNGGKMLSEKVTDALSNQMKEQEIIVKTKQDGSLESILFYGAPTKGFENRNNALRRYINVYSNTDNYMLHWGETQGKRANPTEITGNVQNQPTTYYHKTTFEEEVNNPYIKAAGRSWFGRTIYSTPYVDLLPNLDRSKPILFRFALAHRSSTSGNFTIFENNNQIATVPISAVALSSYQHSKREFKDVEIPSSLIPGDDRSILKIEYQNPSSPTSSTAYLDYYEIHYPRSFYAINNELGFYADTTLRGLTEYSVNGFTGELIGFDLTDISQPKFLFNSSKTNGIFIFRKNLDSNNINRFYLSGKTKSPKLSKVTFDGIMADDGSDMILVTDQTLLNSANKYKEYRETQSNLKVKVVTTQEIYNELNAGTQDITAIRDYLSYVFQKWSKPIKYLLIWGDGHFDYRGVQYKNLNPVPAYQTPDEMVYTFDEIDEAYCTDDYFARIVGDDALVDIAFGRIPINTDQEGFNAIAKIENYENESSIDDWRDRILLMADDGQSGDYYEGSVHVNYSESLFLDHIPDNMVVDKIYLTEFPTEKLPNGRFKPAASEKMVSTLNTNGAVLWNWIGHGNPKVLAHEHLFDRDINVAQLSNYSKLPFMTAATCDFGRFDDPDTKSGAEELFLSSAGGVIGTFSATRVVYGALNAQLNEELYDLIFRPKENGESATIGEIITNLKQSFTRTNDQKFYLLGDPSVKLLIPEYKTKIEKINGIVLNDSSSIIYLKGLSKVEVEGSVLNPSTNQIDNSFNGSAYITMYDGDILKFAHDDVPQQNQFIFQKLGGALTRTATQIINGRFKVSFTIPKDISFSDSTGRLYVYGISDTNSFGKRYFARGVTRKFVVDGIAANDVSDKIPPELIINLDSRKFQSGDVVSNNPLLLVDLYDESGINMAGLGIGHLVEAWIDDDPNSINLTNDLKNSFEKPNYSTIEKILYGIQPGSHQIKIRAWDVFNNYVLDSVNFVTLGPGEGGRINNALLIPNPFLQNGVKIQFTHTIEPPSDAEIIITNSIGKYVRTLTEKLTSYSVGEIYWDGKDNLGNDLPMGTYYFRISLVNSSGIRAESDNLIGIHLN